MFVWVSAHFQLPYSLNKCHPQINAAQIPRLSEINAAANCGRGLAARTYYHAPMCKKQ